MKSKFDTFKAITGCAFKISKKQREKSINELSTQNLTEDELLEKMFLMDLCSKAQVVSYKNGEESTVEGIINEINK